MRSIIYGARHRPLNIPRSTKEYSRATPELFRASIRSIGRLRERRRYFRESVMALERSGGVPVGEAPVAGKRFLRRDRCGRIDDRAMKLQILRSRLNFAVTKDRRDSPSRSSPLEHCSAR